MVIIDKFLSPETRKLYPPGSSGQKMRTGKRNRRKIRIRKRFLLWSPTLYFFLLSRIECRLGRPKKSNPKTLSKLAIMFPAWKARMPEAIAICLNSKCKHIKRFKPHLRSVNIMTLFRTLGTPYLNLKTSRIVLKRLLSRLFLLRHEFREIQLE